LKIEKSAQLSIENKKEEFICAILSLILAVAILAVINYIIFLVYKPNIDEIIQNAVSISIVDKSAFTPEPVERAQYIVSVVLSPFIVFLSYFAMRKLMRNNYLFTKNLNFIYFIGVIGTIIGVILLFYFVSAQDNFYYSQFYVNFLFYAVCLFPCFLACTFLAAKKEFYNKFFSIIFGICSFILIGMLFFMTIFNKNLYYGGLSHLDASFYSVTQVFAGKSLIVDFSNQYGLYPHFLEPIFHIIGLTVLNFSIVMSIITATSFIFIFLFLRKTVSSKVISFLGFTTVVFFCLLMLRLDFFDAYFQYWPIRTIFPTILIFLSAIYLKEENRIIYYSIFILSSIAILWNLDTGAVVFLSWVLLLGYGELRQQDKKIIFKNCISHFFTAISVFSAIIISYSIYIYIRSGSFPNYFLFTQYQQFFYISGFYMLPMKLFYPWNIIIIIYIFGLLYAIFSKENAYITKIIFLLSVLGFGLFSYYQGRSHDYVLTLVAYPAILLLTIFTDISLTNFKKYGYQLYHNLAFALFLIFILSISICSIGYHFDQYYQYSERGFSALNDTKPSLISENIDFIKNSTSNGEKILILGGNLNGIYYGESHTESILNVPSQPEILFVNDDNKLSEFLLNNTDVKVFVDPSIFWNYNNPSRLITILNQNYRVDLVSKSNQMELLRRDFNKSKISIINPEPDTISQITSDMIFVQTPVHLNNNFTVQVLVKPDMNQLPYAAIVGNHPGYNNFEGFIIQQDNSSQNDYTFSYGNGNSWEPGVKFHLNGSEWNYLVITVENKKILVYRNSKLIGSANVTGTIKNSGMPLYIGNWINNDRPFTGPIRDVVISDSSISDNIIKSNWRSVQNKV